VVGHVPAPVGRDDLDARADRKEVFSAGHLSQRNDVRVLEEKQRVGDLAGDAAADEILLEGEGFSVGNRPQRPPAAGGAVVAGRDRNAGGLQIWIACPR